MAIKRWLGGGAASVVLASVAGTALTVSGGVGRLRPTLVRQNRPRNRRA